MHKGMVAMKTRTTVEIDGELLRKAMEYYGCRSKTEVINLGLQELIRAYGRRLLLEDIRLGRSPDLELPYYEENQRLDREHTDKVERLLNG